MDWWNNCTIKMQKGSYYNGMKLLKDVDIKNGEPYVNGVKQTWEDVTALNKNQQRVISKTFSNVKKMVVKDNGITIDGVPIENCYNEKEFVIFNITINGNVERLKVDSAETITVHGNAERIETMSGKVEVSGDVYGDVETMSGKVKAKAIHGDVSTMSGDIEKC